MDSLRSSIKHLHISDRALRPLAIIGGLYLVSQAFALSTWTWLHLLRPGNVKQYLDKNGETWAVVTGSTAGIGKGFVQELASLGFSVVLHGRNEEKLLRLKADLQAEYPRRQFELLVLNACEYTNEEMQTAVAKITHLNIRILVNNVAGGGKHEKPVLDSLQDKTAENIDSWTKGTILFSTQITRILLPTLIDKSSSLVLNIGSGISEMTVPYMCVYAGLKSYNRHWSECLQMELQADGHKHVEVLAIIVGQTATERQDKKLSKVVPSSRQMARSSLAAAGCGHSAIAAYWGHAIQDTIVSFIPSFLSHGMILNISRQMKADERAGKIFQ